MRKALFALALATSVAVPVLADDKHHGKGQAAAAKGATQASAMSDGEIRKVDKDAKKITIKHGPLEKLDMPAMTMVFQVWDPALLDKVKAGDKVRFDAEKVGGGYTVTRIEAAK